MKTKSFTILTVLGFIVALFLLFSIMLYANIQYSPDWKIGEITGGEIICREEKTQFINNDIIPYNAFILGGSKAGFLKPASFEKNTKELKFYNFYTSVGNFSNYELFSNFLIKKHNSSIKEIIIHLSTMETYVYFDNIYTPSLMQNNFFSKAYSYLIFFKEKYLNINYLRKLINYKKNKITSIFQSGEINDYEYINLYKTNKKKYVQERTLSSFNSLIKNLFYDKPQLDFIKKDIESLSRIKQNCEKNNVKLRVIIGANFISAQSLIFGDHFDNYLRDLVSVMGNVYNFSGLNDVNMNPYNFLNAGHFFSFVGDYMIEKIYSTTPNTTDMDAFGILLTKDNIEQFIESQKKKWGDLKTEYELTGTIKLQDLDDKSYLGFVEYDSCY